jgi:hypothetical protein
MSELILNEDNEEDQREVLAALPYQIWILSEYGKPIYSRLNLFIITNFNNVYNVIIIAAAVVKKKCPHFLL